MQEITIIRLLKRSTIGFNKVEKNYQNQFGFILRVMPVKSENKFTTVCLLFWTLKF